jgi:hypothetical protein
MLLSPEDFQDVFIKWVQFLTRDTDLKQICIDGKSLRGSFNKAKSNSAIHMINAWSTGASLSLGQLKTAKKIISKEADYLLAVKSNQPYLEKRVREKFSKLSKPGPKLVNIEILKASNEGHGRIETRTCKVMTAKNGNIFGVNDLEKWPNLNSIIEISSDYIEDSIFKLRLEIFTTLGNKILV